MMMNLRRTPCILLLLLLSCLCWPAWPPEPSPAVKITLEEALGYCHIFNVHKVEELCSDAEKESRSGADAQWIHWVRAITYAKHDLEYRSDRYSVPLAKQIELLKRSRSALVYREIPRNAVVRWFYIPAPATAQEVHSRLIVAEQECRRLASEWDAAWPALRPYMLAVSYNIAAQKLQELGEPADEDMLSSSSMFFAEAMIMDPEDLNIAMYYLDATREMGNVEELTTFALSIAPRYLPYKLPHTLGVSPASLNYLALYYAGLDTGNLPQKAQDDPWVLFYDASVRAEQATSTQTKVQLWDETVNKLTDSRTSAQDRIPAITKSLRQLAYLQFHSGKFQDALSAYRRIQQLSPYYSTNLHDTGWTLYKSANETTGTERIKLVTDAIRSIRKQLPHNWHGTGTQNSITVLSQIADGLPELEPELKLPRLFDHSNMANEGTGMKE